MTLKRDITGELPAAPLPVSLAACLSPFSHQILRTTVAPGQSLFEIFQAPELAAVFEAPQLFVFVNDRLIERSEWLTVRPASGDIISVRVWPSGGGSGGRTLAMIGVTILAIAASALTYGYLSGPAWGAWAGVAAGLAGGAVSLTGTLLVNALIPIQQPKNKSSSQGFSVSGTRNVADPYGPVTRCFGLNRVYPKYAAIPYTELSGSDQYLRCLFLIGRGKYALSAHKIGETAIADLTGVSLETYYTGSGADNFFNIFPFDVYEEALALALTQAGSWQTHSSQVDIDEISLDIAFPNGLYNINAKGNKTAVGVEFEIQYAPYGTTDWINFDSSRDLIFSAAASGDIATGQAVLGLDSDATGTVRFAHYIYDYVTTGYDDEGRPLYEYVQRCDWARVEVASGTFLVGETVRFADTNNADVAAIQEPPVSITAEHHQLYRYGYTIKVPRGQWTVRVRRLTADGRDDTTDTSVLSAFRSISYEAPANLSDCTLVGLQIKATGQLNGIIEQYNCLAQAIIPAHDGTSWNEVATSSPAWAFCEVLRGASNARPVTESRLILTAIRAWDANCAAAGREFNHIVDYRTTVWALAADICAVGRASRGIVDNKFTVIEDLAQSTPVQHFSPRNSWGFRGKRSFPEVPHAFKIKFRNAAAGYVEDEAIVYDTGYTSANATKFEELEFRGVTSADQAWKLGRYHLACVRLRPEVFEFNADVEHLVCTRGSLIRLNHDAISVGVGAGRVKSMTTSGGNIVTVTFDDVFPMATGLSYGFRWRNPSGDSGTATVVTAVGDNYTVTLSPQVTVVSGPVVGDLCQFGEAGLESIPALVTRIDPGGDLSAKLSAVIYDAAVYTADGGTIPTHTTGINFQPVDNRTPAAPSIVSTSYGFKSSRLNDDGTYAIVFTTVFESQASAFVQGGASGDQRPDVIQGFQAQYRVNDGEWITLPLLGPEARSFEFVAADEATYDVRVRSYSLPGLYSAWSTTSDVTIALAGTVPADVTGLQVAGGGAAFVTADCPIEWTAVTGGGTAGLLVKDYKIEVRSADGLTLYRTEYVTQNNFIYGFAKNVEDTAGTPIASMQFRVWARSAWGDLSTNYATLTAANAAPGNPQGLGSRSFMGGVEFYWTANAELDFSHFLYRVKVTSGGSWGDWQRTARTGFERLLSAAEKDAYGADAAIYFEVKAVDVFGQASSSSADDEVCGSLNVKETDIDDFAVSASKIFTKIPVIQGLTLTDNSPAAGRVAWSACTVYYNGTAYAITAGNTATSDQKYIYWKDLAGTFATSATHPASIVGWVPGEDFIIAVNIAGVGQQAWNAIANQVIGSAYIENLGVLDAHIQSISGTKIQATSSIAIGSATFGNDGIQLEYNAGNPRFYAGDGAGNFIKFDGGQVLLAGSMQIIGGSTGNMLPNGDFAQGFSWWVNPAGSNASMSTTFQIASHQSLKIEAYAADSSEVKSVPILVDRSVNYILSAYIKTTVVTTAGFYFRLKEYSDTEGATLLQSTTIANIAAVQDWTRAYGKFGPDGTAFHASTRSIRVEFHWENASHDPAGSAYADAVMVEQVDSWITTPSRFSPQCAAGSVDFAVGSATYGAKGCQIMYNNGTPKFYCGDGDENYIKFDGTNTEFSTDKADAVVIRGSGGIKLIGDDSLPGKIVFSGTSYSSFLAINGDGTTLQIRPNTAAVTDLIIGGDPVYLGQLDFANIHIHARTLARVMAFDSAELWGETESGSTQAFVKALYALSGEYFGQVVCGASSSLGFVSILTRPDGSVTSQYNFSGLNFYPNADKTQSCGVSGGAWDHVFSDDFDNVADFLWLDAIDDLAELQKIKGTGMIDPETGHELIDDDTLPAWLLTRKGGLVEKNSEGKPYIRLKVLLSLLMGACRQLDGIGNAARSRADEIETRMQALEGRRV